MSDAITTLEDAITYFDMGMKHSAIKAVERALQALQSGEPVGEVDERLHDLSERLRATDSQNRYLSLSEQYEICDFIDDLPEGNLYTAPQPVVDVNQKLVEALQAVLDCGSTSDQWWIDKVREALLSAGKGGE